MRLADERDIGRGAALFHATLVAALAAWVTPFAREFDLTTIVGGGGCFLNAILARGLYAALGHRGLALLQAHALPPNDGGLALGQAWIARHEVNGLR
jgi:hydrogenase maturation protein HypF